MQNRYVGDIGDYLKLGILRALSPGYHLGVAWWLFPDEAHNGDGRHIGYLESSRPMAALRPRPVRHARKHRLIRPAEVFGNWRRPTSFPAPRSPASSSHGGRTDAQRQQARTGMAGGRAAEIGTSGPAVSRSRQWIGTCGLSPHGSQIRQEHHDQRATPTREARAVPDRVSSPVSPRRRPPCRDAALG